MSTPVRVAVGLALLAVLAFGGVALMHQGVYGLTLFVLAPVFVGGVGAWIARPASAGEASIAGCVASAAALCSILLFRLDGVLCVMMAMPLAVPLGALGGWLVYLGEHETIARRGLTMLLLLPPATLTWDGKARPPVFEVRSSVEIAATPEQVWKHVVTFSELPEPREWYFRAGLAYPRRARIVGSGAGAVRYCEFSTGPFVEPIETWDEPRLLRFRVTENPAPMHEWSPYAQVLPKHLHGYLVSREGQFRLTALTNGHTLLEGTTWYRHGLWPAEYWRWWSDAIIHRIHLRVLRHIQSLAEGDQSPWR
jgi:hypothetical protein